MYIQHNKKIYKMDQMIANNQVVMPLTPKN